MISGSGNTLQPAGNELHEHPPGTVPDEHPSPSVAMTTIASAPHRGGGGGAGGATVVHLALGDEMQRDATDDAERGTFDDCHNPEELPWRDRTIQDRDETFGPAQCISEHTLFKTQFSLRSTLIGFMPCAALVSAESSQSFFVSQSFILLGGLIGSSPTLGSTVGAALVFLKGALFWLPFCTLMIHLELWLHATAWNFVYAFACFVICVVGTDLTGRLCLIMFNICMMAMQASPVGRSITFPSHGLLELIIGLGFGLFSVIFPVPILSSSLVHKILHAEVARDLVACFPAIHRAFLAPNTTERNILSRRLVMALKTMEEAFQKIQMHMVFAEYEILLLSVLPLPGACHVHLEGVEKYRGFGKGIREQQMRTVVCRTMKQLIFRTACIGRVVEIMKELDVIVPQTEQHAAHNVALMAALDRLTGHISHAIEVLASVPTRESAIAAIQSAELREHMQSVYSCCNALREDLFHNVDYRDYERVQSVVGFYLFAVTQFVEALEDCEKDLENDVNFPSPWLVAWMFGWGSLTSTFTRLWHIMCNPFKKSHLRVYAEAAKISGAMIASVRFFIFMNVQTAYLTGPAVVAFCAADTFGESVHGAFLRLTGVMFGNVLGFFADSYADTPLKKVASICTIIAVCNFFRDGKKYGFSAFYAAFNVISMFSLLGAPKTTTYLTARIQQNTFAVIILALASIVIWPAKPQQALREKRSQTLKALEDTFAVVLGMFSVPLSDVQQMRVRLAELRAKRAAAVAEVEREFACLTAAEDEPFLASILFPVALNRDVYAAERRMLFSLDIIVGAWTLIVSDTEKVVRPTLERFLLALAPTAEELSATSQAITNVLRESVLNPFASLSNDLITEGVAFVHMAHVMRDRLAAGFRAMYLRSQALLARGVVSPASGVTLTGKFGEVVSVADVHIKDLGLAAHDTALHHIISHHRRQKNTTGLSRAEKEVENVLREPAARQEGEPSTAPLRSPAPPLARDRVFLEFMRSVAVKGIYIADGAVDSLNDDENPRRDSGSGEDDANTGATGALNANADHGTFVRAEDMWAIHSLRHALASYVEQGRSMALGIDQMHQFDAMTCVNPQRIPLMRSIAPKVAKW